MSRAIAAAALVVPALLGRAFACDICAVYTATEQRESRAGLHLAIAEQYSHFGTELLDGTEVTLPANEHMDSSVTQFVVGYSFTPRIDLQLSIPYIDRSFTRIHDHQLEHGNESGIGDIALLANLLAYHTVVGESLLRFSVLGGIKFPTGDSSLLAEELAEPVAAAPAVRVAPLHAGEHESGAVDLGSAQALPAEGGLHGHDLTLGSGSFDGIVGAQLFWSWRRAFATAALQYAIRSTGSFDYRFANDLTWVGGPGYYVLLTHQYSVGLRAALSGETKGKDTQQGEKADDTAITALYVGPGLTATWGTSLGVEAGVEFPVVQHDTSLQLVPDLRVRGGLSWRF
jgi:hypothetical protein